MKADLPLDHNSRLVELMASIYQPRLFRRRRKIGATTAINEKPTGSGTLAWLMPSAASKTPAEAASTADWLRSSRTA